jgi:hypothetical protein
VETARHTLLNAMRLVESRREWGARVVYGDTDSMFVLLPGRSRADAFAVGAAMAEAVTRVNPSPIKLQMEKVYHPCFLVSKKRYVGMAYASPTERQPAFDAKGIETVRRDSCGAVAKMVEKGLRVFFARHDLSAVRVYLERQWTKILAGRVALHDFIFAKEVKLGTYSSRGLLPPSALVSTKLMATDPRAEPLYGERVPYVVVEGEPGSRLADLVVSPQEFLENAHKLQLNARYYITKQINPALSRLFNLVGVSVDAWFDALPRPRRRLMPPRCDRTIARLRALGFDLHASVKASRVASLVGSDEWHVWEGEEKERRPLAREEPEVIDIEALEEQRRKAPRWALPRAPQQQQQLQLQRQQEHATIDKFYRSQHCALCDAVTLNVGGVCDECARDVRAVEFAMRGREKAEQRRLASALEACMRCCGSRDASVAVDCDSLDCPVFFQREAAAHALHAALRNRHLFRKHRKLL